MSVSRVEFKTADGVKIVADYYTPPQPSTKGVVLVHMMPATRQSWQNFAPVLQAEGYAALAIDLRGHGESGGGDYRNFGDQEHQASMADLAAAAEFLQGKGVTEIAVAGASIGANLALQFLAENPETRAVVLLSPGIDYRGIVMAPLVSRVSDKQKILLVGAADDAAGMGESCADMAASFGLSQKICYAAGGHGTNLFIAHPDLMSQIIEYLKKEF